MLGVPARLAGCKHAASLQPRRRRTAAYDPAVLYAARVCGVQRVFKLGGAQAVAALAYGTETVPKVDKIFGPGNTWVTEAKAQVDRDPAGAARDYPGRAIGGARDRGRDARTRRSSRRTCCRRPSTAPTRRCCCSRRAPSSRRAVAARDRDAEGAAAAPATRRRRAGALERDRRRRSRDSVRDLEPLCAGAPDPADRAAARLAAARACRGLRVPRPVDAGVRRRLLQRHEPRAADVRFRAAVFEPRRRRTSCAR